jgi:cell division protein FtsI/penicillin-binding protein 2
VTLLLALCAATLQDESTARALQREFPDRSVSYLLIRLENRETAAARWPDVDTPIPVGSLVKPFLLLAYGEAHQSRFPRLTCRGGRDRCWRPSGHGVTGAREALAGSCNHYFRELARNTPESALRSVLHRYGLPPPARDDPDSWIGAGDAWRIPPAAMAMAYAELLRRSAEPAAGAAIQGMKLAASAGTAQAIGIRAMAKTGTASCLSFPRDDGDGFAVALFPREQPRYVLLVRLHGKPGSKAAETAAAMIRVIRP